jgi:hypothetical protein
MKRLDQAGRQVVSDLVHSGIEGRMQPGDTFGVWTFGKEVKGGVFPMQTWRPDYTVDLAGKVGQFLKQNSSGRKSEIATVLTNAESLARAVKDVDILVITSAAATFKAEEAWGVLHQSWNSRFEEARKNNKAIIITLAARSGTIRQATVSLQGERLQLAAPPERKVPQQVTSSKAAAPEPPPRVMREPIIIRGTGRSKPIDEVPTKFAPPPPAPAEPPALDPSLNPAPEPLPVPVRGPEKPIVDTLKHEHEPDLTVAARQPGTLAESAARPISGPVSARMLILLGVALVSIAVVLGTWILLHLRSRGRVSYISRSLANKP